MQYYSQGKRYKMKHKTHPKRAHNCNQNRLQILQEVKHRTSLQEKHSERGT